jgi:Tol biopolymer transport system component
MNADGSNVRQLTSDPVEEYNPAWSPDGQFIAYLNNRSTGSLYIMKSDGSTQRQISDAIHQLLSWAPDGESILATMETRLFVEDLDGNLSYPFTSNYTDREGVWSPDGSKIAFSSNRADDRNIFTMNADGSNIQQLTFDEGLDILPSWSPDGSRLAFVSDRDGNREIYTVVSPK